MSATLVVLLCALACPVAMGLMMLVMRRGHRGPTHPPRERDLGDERCD